MTLLPVNVCYDRPKDISLNGSLGLLRLFDLLAVLGFGDLRHFLILVLVDSNWVLRLLVIDGIS
jgi:hypothetical protein